VGGFVRSPPTSTTEVTEVRSRNSLRGGAGALHFDLCLRATESPDGVALARRCSEPRFVVDHCGNADVKAFLPDAGRRIMTQMTGTDHGTSRRV
jgi:predicted TIM-barrel fold metal-dependent hydrolase